MKQQCHISFIYLGWLTLACGMSFYLFKGSYLQAGLWIIFVALFLWLYVRYFPAISRYMGYGSVEDQAAKQLDRTNANVTLYTGIGCPFCPLVRSRLKELQSKMGFGLKEVDATLKPNLLISKGIRALPVVEVGDVQLIGNATSEQLAKFIIENTTPARATSPA